MKRKLGIIAECLRDVPAEKALPLIKNAGFACYFTGAYEYEAVRSIKAVGDRLGLSLEFLHAPFADINSMWLPGDGYLHIYGKLMAAIDTAAACGVPSVIIHISSGWRPPEINDAGLARFDALVEHAAETGVKLAFENLRKIGNLSYFADRYADAAAVGFCYDAGHEHCYSKYIRWMQVFRERAVATHIHDNFGRGDTEDASSPDLHMLPFDGDIDYAQMMRDLDTYHYDGVLMLEVHNDCRARPDYSEMSHEDFLATAYDRIRRIAAL